MAYLAINGYELPPCKRGVKVIVTTELDERLSALEHMVLKNDFTAPLTVDNSGTLLVDDLGSAIVADWKYKEV